MASSTSQSNHVYVIIRLKMSDNVNGLVGSLFCHYGEIDDAFLIGGLVWPNETLMASVIRNCRRLVDFHLKPSHRLYLAKVINGLVYHEMVKISIYVVDVLFFSQTFVGGLDTIPLGWLLSLSTIWSTLKHRTRDRWDHSLLLRFRLAWLFRLRMEP